MLKKLALSLVIGLSSYSITSQAAPIVTDSVALMQSVLQQERQWAGLESKTIKVGETTFAYSEGGVKGAPTVLLVHGFSGSRDNWNRIAHKLTKKYHVVAVDLPGHGDTIAPESFGYQLADLSDAVRQFVLALGIQKDLHIAGHSLGGGIAVLYSALYFLEVKSVLLVDTAGVYDKVGNSLISKPEELKNMLVRKQGDFERLATKIAMYNPPFIPKELMEGYEKLHVKHLPEHEKLINALIKQMEFTKPETFQMAAHSIEAPTLVIWGDKDAVIDVSVVEELKEHLKNEEVLILKDVGHTPILEADYPVSEAYLAFLAKAQAMPNKFAPAATPSTK
ncbi:MAG: alpha/beta hydrolase [Moraxellaceae bacterium]|jgi:pimeloyl-ACP methyl ester carboxylesterase|nr:alpha/beta hydrolase [Moraxellaceae bacterium]MBL0230020.1 alpha/beta hydrolase [Moraxellaceae bacterium]MCC6373339.1 alpha/beta hydrolase [Moraxellaceae bacterium]